MAGIRIDVRQDMKRMVAEFSTLRSDVKDKATYRALNRALDKLVTETGREVRKVYKVRLRTVRDALNTKRASVRNLQARLLVDGVRLPIIEFSPRWRRGMPVGASVQVMVSGGRKNIRGAFIAEMKSGHRGVFRRRGRSRLPIDEIRTISIPQAVINKMVSAALERAAVDTFNKNFAQQVRYLSGGV